MSIDRQYGKTLSDIRKDHVERYKFASARVQGRVLDAACGCGYGSCMLGYHVTGIDVEPEALAWARKYWSGPKYIQADLNNFSASGFEWAVSFETIEHLQDPTRFLSNLYIPNLICSVPNEEKAPFRAEAFVNDKYPHVRHYTPEQFDELLDSGGWVVTRRSSQKDKYSPVEPGIEGMYLVYECIRKPGS